MATATLKPGMPRASHSFAMARACSRAATYEADFSCTATVVAADWVLILDAAATPHANNRSTARNLRCESRPLLNKRKCVMRNTSIYGENERAYVATRASKKVLHRCPNSSTSSVIDVRDASGHN